MDPQTVVPEVVTLTQLHGQLGQNGHNLPIFENGIQ